MSWFNRRKNTVPTVEELNEKVQALQRNIDSKNDFIQALKLELARLDDKLKQLNVSQITYNLDTPVTLSALVDLVVAALQDKLRISVMNAVNQAVTPINLVTVTDFAIGSLDMQRVQKELINALLPSVQSSVDLKALIQALLSSSAFQQSLLDLVDEDLLSVSLSTSLLKKLEEDEVWLSKLTTAIAANPDFQDTAWGEIDYDDLVSAIAAKLVELKEVRVDTSSLAEKLAQLLSDSGNLDMDELISVLAESLVVRLTISLNKDKVE